MSEQTKFQPKDYWESRLNSNWGLHGVGYLGLSIFNKYVYHAKGDVFRRVVRSLKLPNGFKALDVGCGTGFYIEQWKRLRVGSLTGMDLTEVAVAKLRQTFPDVRFIQADISQAGESLSEKFDVISAMDVLFHLVDDARYLEALRSLHGLLSDDGYFIFSEFFLNRETSVARHHVSRSLTSISSMLRQAGFSTIRRIPVHILMNQPLDTPGTICMALWDRFTDFLERHQWAGKIAGPLLYAVDSVLVRLLRQGPSTELMVCRKI